MNNRFKVWDKQKKKFFYFDLSEKAAFWEDKLKLGILRRYIGRKDINDVKIYEGDNLIEKCYLDEEDESKGFSVMLFRVVWDNEKLMWCIDSSFNQDGSFITSLVGYFGKHAEVSSVDINMDEDLCQY
jgi:hypothetical protein